MEEIRRRIRALEAEENEIDSALEQRRHVQSSLAADAQQLESLLKVTMRTENGLKLAYCLHSIASNIARSWTSRKISPSSSTTVRSITTEIFLATAEALRADSSPGRHSNVY